MCVTSSAVGGFHCVASRLYLLSGEWLFRLLHQLTFASIVVDIV